MMQELEEPSVQSFAHGELASRSSSPGVAEGTEEAVGPIVLDEVVGETRLIFRFTACLLDPEKTKWVKHKFGKIKGFHEINIVKRYIDVQLLNQNKFRFIFI